MKNVAYIDGQNLHLGTVENGWKLDLNKFRIYLKEKYKVDKAYYFLGFLDEDIQDLYKNLQEAGFVVSFREHSKNMVGTKKGNVDTEIVFESMKMLVEKEDFNNLILVSGDGDYRKLVDYFIKKSKFGKIIFPNYVRASSLYKDLGNKYFISLDRKDVRTRLEYKK